MAKSLGELASTLGCEIVGDPDASISAVATLALGQPGAISFFANQAYSEALRNTKASAVILAEENVSLSPTNAVISSNPYLAYARIAEILYPKDLFEGAIHSSASVAKSASVAQSAYVAAHAVIDEHCVIGEHVYIGPGVVVGPRCNIDAQSRLLANCTLVQDVSIGKRSTIHSGAVLGSDGFGNAMSDSGWVKVPQVGGLSIGDDVEIGCNSTIDRGAIGDTIVGNGVRLDNLIQIAHNVVIGEHTAMAGMTGIAGSTVIGKRCMFAGQTGSVGHITICDDVVIGAQSYVSKDIREPGIYVASFPAEKDKDWKRKVVRFRNLADLFRRVGKLEKGKQ